MNNNQKATKRALLTSVMALVMCVVMLVGTTFAWFTDTASTAVNKIQAGNLDIELEYATEWNTDGSVKHGARPRARRCNLRRLPVTRAKRFSGSRAAGMCCLSCALSTRAIWR